MRYGYLVVEGYDDAEFVGRLLRARGLQRVQQLSHVQPFWKRLIPRDFPFGDDLLKRVPVPAFFQSDGISVAVHASGSFERILDTIQESLTILGRSRAEIEAVGLVADADQADPTGRFSELQQGFTALGLPSPTALGAVDVGPPRTGTYLFPDNEQPGTLERVLLDCAAETWPEALAAAQSLVEQVAEHPEWLPGRDRAELDRPFGREKALIGCLGNILKPGKTIQVSIQDSRWIGSTSLTLVRVAAFLEFLDQLFLLTSYHPEADGGP